MNREIRKLSKKIDELQKQINYQNECIMDQSMIIHMLKEKIVGYSPYLDERFTGPMKPKSPYEEPAPWREPWNSNNVKCSHCGRDTGIPMLLHMVIPPEGLKCPHCNKTAVYSSSPTSTCQVTPIRDEDNICGGVRVTRETTPITFRQSYDGTLSTLPVSTPEKWTVTKKLPVVKTDSANLDASF